MGFSFYYVQRKWWNCFLNHKAMFKIVINADCGLNFADLYKVDCHEDDVRFRNR